MKRTLLLAIVCTIVLSAPLATMGAQPVDIGGTYWVLDGKNKLNAGKYGRQNVKGPLYVTIENSGYVEITDEDGYSFSGTYSTAPEGSLSLDIDEDDIAEFIIDGIGLAASYADINVTSVQTQLKAVPKKNGMVQLSLSVKFTVNIEVEDPYSYDDKTIKVKLTSNISGKGSQNMLAGAVPTGSRWSIPATAKFKAKKIKHNEMLNMELIMGPDESFGLDDTEFEIYVNTDSSSDLLLSGHYWRSGKKVTFVPYEGMGYDVLQTFADTAIADMDDIYYLGIMDEAAVITATVNDGKSIKFNVKTIFWASVETHNRDFDCRGRFTVNAKGTPK